MNQWVSLSERGALSNAHQERPSGAEVFLTAPHDVGIGGQYNPKRMDITRLRSKKHGNQPHELHTGSMSAREPEYRDSDAGAGCPPMSSREVSLRNYNIQYVLPPANGSIIIYTRLNYPQLHVD